MSIILPHEKRFVCVVVRETPRSKRYTIDTFAYPDEAFNVFKMRIDEALKTHRDIPGKFDVEALPSCPVYFKTSARSTTEHMQVFNENTWITLFTEKWKNKVHSVKRTDPPPVFSEQIFELVIFGKRAAGANFNRATQRRMNEACARVSEFQLAQNVNIGPLERHVMALQLARSGQPAEAPVERPESLTGRQARRIDQEVAAFASAAGRLDDNNDCCRLDECVFEGTFSSAMGEARGTFKGAIELPLGPLRKALGLPRFKMWDPALDNFNQVQAASADNIYNPDQPDVDHLPALLPATPAPPPPAELHEEIARKQREEAAQKAAEEAAVDAERQRQAAAEAAAAEAAAVEAERQRQAAAEVAAVEAERQRQAAAEAAAVEAERQRQAAAEVAAAKRKKKRKRRRKCGTPGCEQDAYHLGECDN
jgi:hypothetical protein